MLKLSSLFFFLTTFNFFFFALLIVGGDFVLDIFPILDLPAPFIDRFHCSPFFLHSRR